MKYVQLNTSAIFNVQIQKMIQDYTNICVAMKITNKILMIT